MKLQKQTGVAAVELALIMVPMLVLCFGIVEVGRALYYYDGLVKAARGAARYLTAKDLNPLASGTLYGSSSTNPDVKTAIALAWCGMPTCASGATSLIPGLDASKVTVTTNNHVQPTNDGSTSVGTVNLVTICIGYGYDEIEKLVCNPDPNAAIWFESFLPYTITRFKFSPVTITMAWSVT